MRPYRLIIISLVATIFVGCASRYTEPFPSAHMYEQQSDHYDYTPYDEAPSVRFIAAEPALSTTDRYRMQQERLIQHEASLTLEVPEPDSAQHQILIIAQQFSGYMVRSSTYMVMIRVPAEHYEAASETISALGKVLSRHASGTDVTDEYRDLEIRLDNAQKARNRYLELLAKAENVEAALQVEKELERLNTEIDLLKGRLQHMSHRIEFSTITVHLRKKVKLGVLGFLAYHTYKAIEWLFVRDY